MAFARKSVEIKFIIFGFFEIVIKGGKMLDTRCRRPKLMVEGKGFSLINTTTELSKRRKIILKKEINPPESDAYSTALIF